MAPGSESLHFLVPTYRRDSSAIIGAVRRSSVEFLGMEQMPGGKFQITARTISGADAFVSAVKTSLAEAQACLEDARRSFGGELMRQPDIRGEVFVSAFDSIPQRREQLSDVVPPVEDEVPPVEDSVRPEPRIPTFTFADIEAPELPTSVH